MLFRSVHDVYDTDPQEELVRVLLEERITHVEASAFVRVTPAFIRYVGVGLQRSTDGRVDRRTHLLAKVSRPEVAREFLAPVPPEIIEDLLACGQLTVEQADLFPCRR